MEAPSAANLWLDQSAPPPQQAGLAPPAKAERRGRKRSLAEDTGGQRSATAAAAAEAMMQAAGAGPAMGMAEPANTVVKLKIKHQRSGAVAKVVLHPPTHQTNV